MERRGRSTLPSEVTIGGYCLGLGSEGGVFTAVPCCFGQESYGYGEGIRLRIRLAKLKLT